MILADKNREKMEKFQILDLSYFIGKSYFNNDGSQNYLLFQPIYNTFIRPTGHTETIITWNSKILSNESTVSCGSLAPKVNQIHNSVVA